MMFAGRLPGPGGREGGRRRGVCCLLDLRWVVVMCQLVAADLNQGIRGQARNLGISITTRLRSVNSEKSEIFANGTVDDIQNIF